MRLAVIDSNIALSWFFPDEESSAEATRLLVDFRANRVRLIVPSLWEYEVINTLHVGVLRGRISRQEGDDYCQTLLDMNVEFHEFKLLALAARKLAIRHNLTIYDASYLALAELYRCEFYSFDKQLVKAARKSGLIHLPEEFS